MSCSFPFFQADLLPRHLKGLSAGYPMHLVLRIAEHHRLGVFSSCWQAELFFEKFIGGGRHRDKASPAGADAECRRSDIEMGKGDDGVDR